MCWFKKKQRRDIMYEEIKNKRIFIKYELQKIGMIDNSIVQQYHCFYEKYFTTMFDE